ncbi:hypothetical protein Hanom_Chr12g01126141 [Helianthus anomalus]
MLHPINKFSYKKPLRENQTSKTFRNYPKFLSLLNTTTIISNKINQNRWRIQSNNTRHPHLPLISTTISIPIKKTDQMSKIHPYFNPKQIYKTLIL